MPDLAMPDLLGKAPRATPCVTRACGPERVSKGGCISAYASNVWALRQ